MNLKKEKNVIRFFLDFYKRFSIPWWLYLLSAVLGVLYAEIAIKIASLLIQVNKGELYNSVILGYVLLTVLNAVLVFAENILQAYGNQSIIFRARKILWDKLLHVPVKTVEEHQPSNLISAMTNEAEQSSGIINMLFLTVASIYGFVRSCMVLFQFQAELAAYLLLLVPAALLVFFLVGKMEYRIMKKRYDSINQMTAFFSEHLSAGKYVKAQAMEEKELESGFQAIDTRYYADIYYAVMSALQVFLNSIYTNLTTVAIALGGSKMINAGRMESTGINTFSNYSQEVNRYLAENLTHYQSLMGMKGALWHMDQLFHEEEEHPEEGLPWQDGGEGDIVFEHVSFSYQPGETVLRDLSVRIPAGKTTAVIGGNGCGKSTVMKLMQGFYSPDSGRIWVSGNQAGKVKMSELRKRFGYVLQNNPMFSGSIRDNMVYGLERDVTEEEIDKLAKQVCIHEFAAQLPGKYETVMGESGGRLSGGQRQRIAIARALLRDPEYLILDEAGASLDYDTYQRVYQGILKNRKGRTIIFIAHDMKEVMEADYIIILKKGMLEACGTHEELVTSSGIYQEYLRKMEEGAVS